MVLSQNRAQTCVDFLVNEKVVLIVSFYGLEKVLPISLIALSHKYEGRRYTYKGVVLLKSTQLTPKR